uniref:Lipocalin-like domain-containing protein n=1 Tax=Minutocellus polymorphus TaxID=265543 RepID=A0A6U0KI98_9STRA|mmetsp:Transcript_4354/g.7437  ORF Transcript_4354/g.7437 Transcript_4354/m.7437 type:complete len:177 (+) Transcript_4354:63-593(+)
MLTKALIPLALCGCSSAFVSPAVRYSQQITALNADGVTGHPSFVANKYYQLEELEDRDDCSTEVLLKDDGTVTTGATDGPPPSESSGTWEFAGDTFKMELKRVYQGGEPPLKSTDVGEFKYEVKRSYEGELTHVGAEMAVTGGKIRLLHDELGDDAVGFFNLLDTTSARPGGTVAS